MIQTNFYFSYVRPYDTTKFFKEGKDSSDKFKLVPINKMVSIPFRNIVLADFTLSKIEDKNRELPVRYTNQDAFNGYLNRLDLYQYANIKVTSKINLFTLEWLEKKAFKAYFDIIGVFYRTELFDSLEISDTKSVISTAYGFNFKMRIYEDPRTNLSAELSYSYFKPFLYSSSYKEISGPQYLNHKRQLTQDMVNEKNTGINIIDLLIGHKGNTSTQFLRVSLSGNYFIKKSNITPNIFCQFQMGVRYDLNKIFSSDNEKATSTQQN